MVPVFQIVGSSNVSYIGSFCLPQVPLPANRTANVRDNATVRLVETAIDGPGLFSASLPLPIFPQYKLLGLEMEGDFQQ